MSTYDFKNFSYCDVDIIIPEDTYFCRGIDVSTTEIIRDMPIYIGPEYVAKEYGKVYYLKAKTDLKLIDIRKLMHLMKLIIASRKSNNADIKKSIYYITMAFGLCSYDKQIKLLEEFSEYIKTYSNSKEAVDYFNYCLTNMKSIDPSTKLNPFEPEGVRVAETYIDGFVITILKELFNGIYDGFIAPKLISPFHKDNKTHEEIVLFDPKNKLEVSPIDIKLEIKPIEVNITDISNAPIPIDLHKEYKSFKKIIVMASRLSSEKNVKYGIDIFNEIQKKNNSCALVISGDGPMFKSLKDYVEEKGLVGKVFFRGWVSRDLIYSFYKTSDVFLNTSWYEGYGLSIVEANMAGVKVVSTDVGIARDLDITIIDFNDVIGSSNKILQLIK